MDFRDFFYNNAFTSVKIVTDNGKSCVELLCRISIHMQRCLKDKSCGVVHISFLEDMRSSRECMDLVWFSLCKFDYWGSFYHADGENITRRFIHYGTDDCFELLEVESSLNDVILKKCNIHEVIPNIDGSFVTINEILHDQAILSQYAEYQELKVKYKESLEEAAYWIQSELEALDDSCGDNGFEELDDDNWDDDNADGEKNDESWDILYNKERSEHEDMDVLSEIFSDCFSDDDNEGSINNEDDCVDADDCDSEESDISLTVEEENLENDVYNE